MVSFALDPALAALQRKEAEGLELSFAVRRFCSYMRSGSAVEAMQSAVAELLRSYGRRFGPSASRISAAQLCEACGVTLAGPLPRRTATRLPFSALRPWSKRKEHTGSLLLDPMRPTIRLPSGLDYFRARVAVGHELGHLLVHRRGDAIDRFTARLPNSEDEEALSEYSSRLLLLSQVPSMAAGGSANVISACMRLARDADVTLHAAAARLGDPDSPLAGSVAGIILWRCNPTVETLGPVHHRLTPAWHLCRQAFIPIGRCHARKDSLVAELGADDSGVCSGSRVEPVSIGAFKGDYRIDAVAWGSVARGTRHVLAAFLIP